MRKSKEKEFEKLYAQYKDSVFCVSLMYLKDYQLAEDATQETFIKVLSKLRSLKEESKAKAWISKIAINVCRDKLRHSSKREIPSQTLPEDAAHSSHTDLRLTVGEAIGKLDPKLRETVILHYYQGFTHQEIADILRIPLSTVGYRLRTAKAQLKDFLKEDIR
ncbi:MAG: RNA polymerase sigma factor [Ruminococcus sp.]|nr:RNA polymerase sigma factor [Ruminococcus sp.]